MEVLDSVRCPRFVGRYMDGVKVGPSPLDVQRRLMAAGMRPVSNVVDASNYVMVELGKPVHTFDAAAVADGHIIVRDAVAGERLETLDHVGRDLDPETLLIADRATGRWALPASWAAPRVRGLRRNDGGRSSSRPSSTP